MASDSDTDVADSEGPEPEPIGDQDDDVDEEPRLAEMDPEDIDVDELEEQDWTLGGEQQEVIDFGGMQFLVEDPGDEAILDMIASAPGMPTEGGEEESASDRLFMFCRDAVVAPELTAERWREMRSGERIGLSIRIGDVLGIGSLMDFPDGGPDLPQES